MIKFFLLSLVVFQVHAHHHVPEDRSVFSGAFIFRGIKKIEKTSLLYEVNQSTKIDSRTPGHLKFTARRRIFSNLKVGVFYENGWGKIHDQDWVGKNGDWFWRNTDSRHEDIVGVEVLPRWSLSLFPGRWVFDIRNVYEINLDFGFQFFLFMPGITGFFFKNGKPSFNLNFRIGSYHRLNKQNGVGTYRNFLYASYIYNRLKKYKPFINVSYGFQKWGPSNQFEAAKQGETYIYGERAYSLNLGLVFLH